MNNQLREKFDIINDSEMKNALLEFYNTIELTDGIINNTITYLSVYKDVKLKDLNRETIWDACAKVEFTWLKQRFGTVNFKFIQFLLNNKISQENDAYVLKEFINAIAPMNNNKNERIIILNKDTDLSRFFIFDRSTDKAISKILVDTKINNKFIVKLLNDFFNSGLYFKKNLKPELAKNFWESYDFSSFKSVLDFNYLVFEKQYNFFKDDIEQLRVLIKFYIYLYSSSGNIEIFKATDPVDIVWMQDSKFLFLYSQGFRLVDYNPFEPIPSGDKWIVRPNGVEEYSTQMIFSRYIKISFEKLEYKPYVDYVKYFFWNHECNLITKRAHLWKIIEFLNFIYKYKNNNIHSFAGGIDYKKITTREIYSYVQFNQDCNLAASSQNIKQGSIKLFLNMCLDEGFLEVEKAAFDYLSTEVVGYSGGSCIPDGDLEIIEKHLKELADRDTSNMLYYILFHLLIDTHMRISHLISLTISSIKEGMKKGQFFIHSIHKTSNKEKEMQPISQYTKRHLDIAIKITEELRNTCAEEYKDFIFLKIPMYGNIKEIRPINKDNFDRFFKKQCKVLNLKSYSASNLRDTHMTKAIEHAFKNNWSQQQISSLTWHKNQATTFNNYVDYKIKTYAEMTYEVTIGDVDIKGNIIPKINNEFTKEETVDDGCGFCKKDECYILSELGCPMCDGFVVTLDRIPFYEKKIACIDELIKKEKIDHEREHLSTIKSLYVAYLARLYALKDSLA